MATPSKKRRVISLELKKRIIDASSGKKSDELSKQFGLPAFSIRNILGERKTILEAIDEGNKAKRMHLKMAKYDDLEEAVLRWFKAARSANAPKSGPLLAEKAYALAIESAKPLKNALGYGPWTKEQSKTEVAKKLANLENFKASDFGWASSRHVTQSSSKKTKGKQRTSTWRCLEIGSKMFYSNHSRTSRRTISSTRMRQVSFTISFQARLWRLKTSDAPPARRAKKGSQFLGQLI